MEVFYAANYEPNTAAVDSYQLIQPGDRIADWNFRREGFPYPTLYL